MQRYRLKTSLYFSSGYSRRNYSLPFPRCGTTHGAVQEILRYPVCDLKNFVHAVRDINDARALCLQFSNQIEKDFDFPIRKA